MNTEDDGWMTVYATGGFVRPEPFTVYETGGFVRPEPFTVYETGGFVRPEPFTVRDIRTAIETLRKNALPTTNGLYSFDGARGFVEPRPPVRPQAGLVGEASADRFARALKAAMPSADAEGVPVVVTPVPNVDNGDLAHWCPGCKMVHVLPWKRGSWTFNGDTQRPTFMPSFRHSWGMYETGKPTPKVCHYIVAAGILNFCADCTHALAGKTVPVEPIPEGASWV